MLIVIFITIQPSILLSGKLLVPVYVAERIHFLLLVCQHKIWL